MQIWFFLTLYTNINCFKGKGKAIQQQIDLTAPAMDKIKNPQITWIVEILTTGTTNIILLKNKSMKKTYVPAISIEYLRWIS